MMKEKQKNSQPPIPKISIRRSYFLIMGIVAMGIALWLCIIAFFLVYPLFL
jgi:hypothetical protein